MSDAELETDSSRPEDAPNPWAAYLRDARRRWNWTVKQLADASGLHKSIIYRWQNGDVRNLTLQSIQLIATAVGDDLTLALNAAAATVSGQLARQSELPADDWEIRMIRDSGLREEVIEQLVADTLERRDRERASRRAELENQIDLLRVANG